MGTEISAQHPEDRLFTNASQKSVRCLAQGLKILLIQCHDPSSCLGSQDETDLQSVCPWDISLNLSHRGPV